MRYNRHYKKLLREIATNTPLEVVKDPEPLIVIAMTGWTTVSKQALRSAMSLSREIKVVHVAEGGKPDEFCDHWIEYVQQPATAAGFAVPELVVLKSPYRFVIAPMVNYVRTLARKNPDRRVVAIVPELVEKRRYYYFLHTQRATLLETQLLMEGNDRISVLNIPWYLKSG